MKEEKKYTYIQFPLCLLQETYYDAMEGFNQIIDFGIVNYGKKFTYDIEEVARQLMYAYYRRRNKIQDELYNVVNECVQKGYITINDEYNGFSAYGFDPACEIVEIVNLFEKNECFKNASILRWQIDKAAEFKYSLCLDNVSSNLSLFMQHTYKYLPVFYNQGIDAVSGYCNIPYTP